MSKSVPEVKEKCPKCKSFNISRMSLGFEYDRIDCKQCGYSYDEKVGDYDCS